MSSKINLQTCEYACKSSIFQDNQLIFVKTAFLLLQELLSEVQNLCLKECWCGNSNQKNVIIEKKT